MRLVNIVQHMWLTGEIPQELGWIILFLIPKGSTYSQCIGLLETLWKVVEVIIDTRLRTSIHFHDVIYGLWAGKGTRTAIMEMKVAQELASVDHKPIFLVFLDLRKTYDTVYRGRLIWTLEGYGAGPRLCELVISGANHAVTVFYHPVEVHPLIFHHQGQPLPNGVVYDGVEEHW